MEISKHDWKIRQPMRLSLKRPRVCLKEKKTHPTNQKRRPTNQKRRSNKSKSHPTNQKRTIKPTYDHRYIINHNQYLYRLNLSSNHNDPQSIDNSEEKFSFSISILIFS